MPDRRRRRVCSHYQYCFSPVHVAFNFVYAETLCWPALVRPARRVWRLLLCCWQPTKPAHTHTYTYTQQRITHFDRARRSRHSQFRTRAPLMHSDRRRRRRQHQSSHRRRNPSRRRQCLARLSGRCATAAAHSRVIGGSLWCVGVLLCVFWF